MLGGITKYLQRHHIALLALFLALGGTSFAAASFINGKQIKPNSIPKNRLTKSAVRSLKGAKGVQGLPGQRGPTGPLGPSNPNASTLQGFPATSLARATTATAGTGVNPCAGGAIFTAFNTVTFTNAVSKSITAPTAGVLLVFGHTSFEFENAGPGTNVSLIGRLAVDGVQKGQMAEGNSSNVVSSCNGGRTMSLDTAVAVAAGNHTVAYQIAKSGGDGNAFVGNASVTTLFVPFGNAGSQGILGSHSPASHSGVSNH
jgi:hypothetical protein